MTDELSNKTQFSFKEFFKLHKKKIISTALLIIFSIIGLILFDEYKNRKISNISEKFNKAKMLIEKDNKSEALKILEKIINEKNSFYSPSALNIIIDNNLIKDRSKVLSYYDLILSNKNLDEETKNLFLFKKIIYLGDDIKENELLTSLKPMMQSNSLWKTTVADYIKKYYLSKGEFNKAKEFETSTK